MKKLFTLFAILLLVGAAQGQTDWFFSVSTGYGFGGPLQSINKNMERSNLGQKSPGVNFLGLYFEGPQYPIKEAGVPFLVKAGKKLKEGKSLYVVGGVPNRGEVSGFENSGVYGNSIHIRYKIVQLGAGYQYSFSKTRSKLGLGPSLLILRYEEGLINVRKYTSLVPGASLMARVPLGKEKRLIGVDLVLDGSLAPPARMKEVQVSRTEGNQVLTSSLKEKSVNMIHGMIGIALSLRN